ncbi:MAG: tRNA (adenosine(37)-N6)-threonylcarbamoyltransferase complex dimerization subunit type 1 TsaB [Pseudomonadota bacterium]
MLLLALDTSAHLCAVALYDCTIPGIVCEDVQNIGRGHAEILMPQIEACLSKAGKTYSDIDRIGVIKGPGSFTGLRVGLSVAKGLSLSLDIDAVGLSALDICEAVAIENGMSGKFLTIMDARREQAYCKFSDSDEQFIKTYQEIAETLPTDIEAICGSGSLRLRQAYSADLPILHELAAPPVTMLAKLSCLAKEDVNPAEPLYLRSADAKPQTGFALKTA